MPWLRAAVFLALLLAAHSAQAAIVVAVAANLQHAFEEIRREFSLRTGIEVRPVYGASGKLQSQIRAGAPFDVLVAADVDGPDSLAKGRHAIGPSRIYAYGRAVLWVAGGVPVERGLECLRDPTVSRIAIGDVRLTVYGPAAWRALGKAGILEEVRPKLVYGTSVGQVARYIESGAVQAGILGKGQVLGVGIAGKGRWIEIPETMTGRLPQAMIATRHGAEHDSKSAKRFLDFMGGEAARRILERHGYGLPGAGLARVDAGEADANATRGRR